MNHKKLLLTAALALFSVNALAQSQGDWLLRLGLGHVAPDADSGNLVFEGIELDDYRIDVDENTRPIINVTYMASDHLGVELLAAWPFNHSVEGDGALAGLGKLGSTKHLPPTLSLQYHFRPDQTFRPYAGVGLNYTKFFDEKTTDSLHQGIIGTSNTALGTDYAGGNTDMTIDDSFGIALQLGADVALNDAWFVNFDLRWIDIEADAELRTTTVDGDGFEVDLDSRIKADIDPWVFSTAIGLRF
ncbi:OmpW/AlkL family protein [Wenzhouxiangella sp. EGI_FJ10305]|uniref:OmpW/AlkL family protein n=1 Tax=Wenzhouxiangella sp. EGI_FJ10305 TaxID=3243768 RepID=UPI0035DB65F9